MNRKMHYDFLFMDILLGVSTRVKETVIHKRT